MSQQTSLSQFFKKSNDTNVLQVDHHKSSVSVNVEKEEVLKKIWKPGTTFEFPNTVIFSGKYKRSKNLKFQYRWLHTFPLLAYSAKLDGAFCTFCVAFAKSGAGINSQTLGALVRKPFQNWKHAMETFKNHVTLQYHKQSVFDADHFIDIKKNVHLSIENQLDTARALHIFENRINISPVIETIILCGRQNILLRGHRDFGKLTVDNNDVNDGNFRNLLRFRARGDASLKLHLESSGTIKYTSPISQNAIIDSCNSILLNKIVARVNEAKCFTVLVDETADIAGLEQVSICVRYIDLKSYELHEDFLQFVPTTDASGKGLSRLILDNLREFGIDTQYLRDQGYDGAAAMAGKYNGVQAYIKKEHPLALYVHCSAHSLNLAVSVSCNVFQIRNCMGTIGKLRDFFVFPKRKSVLSKAIEMSENNISKKSLKRNCETRWIERYHSVSDFLELFECVEEALEEIFEWDHTDTSNQASAFRNSILQPEFIITVVTVGIINKTPYIM
ncbi:unnamed protein product [Macrosiphum euphorbiae]|uniref:DUF4371 domain-containing protein n=1 Tax=Macrosiphum euphorbiae TaxID=13131 RepID=A0AAV0XRZ7_9HEMI|nr:unnamed protein product [Macrosiphum euphorbiae]